MQADCSTVPCFYVQVIEMARLKKKERHEILLRQVREKPFLTDEELAGLFEVSIQTIRLDRMELGIPEVRERIRQVAEKAQDNITALEKTEVVGDVIDLERGHSGISLLKITEDMVFARNKIAKGHFIFSQANSLALANIKYKVPVKVGEMLIAKAEVIKQRSNKFFVWVKTRNEKQEVFRAKFIMVSLAEVN